ncbi:uncharacterized protein LOC125872817 [Solanum stenotomum]|uniref:uncharacterized protein LOC125872817 n=1 Tax=Solanum stenotomum TaxID=172797 RepID=UPI0020D0812D|nr:uncharacterized protein LOC125872817 [Solanum stenotomum]
MSKFLFGLSNLVKTESKNAMLLGDMDNKNDLCSAAKVGRLGSTSGNKSFPTCPKYGKNHLDECLADKEGCFRCGHYGSWLKDFLSARQGEGCKNNRAQSTAPTTLAGRPTQQGASSGTGGG